METVRTAVENGKQDASRFELLVRLVYWIPLGVVYYVMMFIGFFAILANLGSVIVRGKRSVRASGFLKTLADYLYKIWAYYWLLTDERPPIVPE